MLTTTAWWIGLGVTGAACAYAAIRQHRLDRPLRSTVSLAGGALLAAVALAFGPFLGGEDKHGDPWPLTVDGNTTGIVAVAGLDPLVSGPAAVWVARTASAHEWNVDAVIPDQTESAQDAWRAAASWYHDDADFWMVQGGPDLRIPQAWIGKSAGLAYTLAYIDSAPLNPTPGSLIAGRTIAATGRVTENGHLGQVGYLKAKTKAAQAADADVLLVPWRSYDAARTAGLRFPPTGELKIVPVFSLTDAVRYLCATGGTGAPCRVVTERRLAASQDPFTRMAEALTPAVVDASGFDTHPKTRR